jgi:tetratricopeptide (TPR) repeat protein
MNSMKLNLTILILSAVFSGLAAGQQSEIETGRAYYTGGEFKKAAAHFQLAIKTDPNNAEPYYWMGMSYQRLADIALPFGGRYNERAHFFLTKAVELAPGRPDYRGELFEFLLDPAVWSRAALREAAGILQNTSESDPEYGYMRRRFERESKANSSAEARLGRLVLAVPQTAYRIAELPAPALLNRHEAQCQEVQSQQVQSHEAQPPEVAQQWRLGQTGAPANAGKSPEPPDFPR